MTRPKTPSLAELGKILGDLVPTLQWIEGVQDVTVRALMQETNALLGGQQVTEAVARVVAWRVLTDLGQYVRDVAPDDEQPVEPAAETFD